MAGEYDVGYCKPPKHTQFKSGKSGNPKGRPKGTKNLKTDLEEELQEMIAVKIDGNPKKISKQRALIKSLTAKALKGDTRAATMIINLVVRLLQGDEDDTALADLTEMDAAILAEFEAKILNASAKTTNGSQGKGGNDENE